MRVAVVGMLGRQEQLIAVDSYKNLDIRFANKGSKYGISQSALFNNVDRILVMTKFVSHSLTENLDRSKTTLIHGGFSKLKACLATLDTTARISAPAKPVITEKEAEEMALEKFDFGPIMKAAKVGDVLEFPRPRHTTLDQWSQRIAQMRSYYKRIAGIHSDVEFKEGNAIVMITRIVPPGSKEEGIQERKVVSTPHPAILESTLARPSAQPAQGPVLVDLDRQFWTDVFMTSMRQMPYTPIDAHVSAANAALAALHLKFPGAA